MGDKHLKWKSFYHSFTKTVYTPQLGHMHLYGVRFGVTVLPFQPAKKEKIEKMEWLVEHTNVLTQSHMDQHFPYSLYIGHNVQNSLIFPNKQIIKKGTKKKIINLKTSYREVASSH